MRNICRKSWRLSGEEATKKCVVIDHSETLEKCPSLKIFYRTQVPGVRSMGPNVSNSRFWNFTNVTLTDEDTNSIQTDNSKRAFHGKSDVTWLQVVPLGDSIFCWCKWRLLVTKFVTDVSTATGQFDKLFLKWSSWDNWEISHCLDRHHCQIY